MNNGQKERIVILGGGFAGLKLARKLQKSNYDIFLIDKHNYHQFQPLLRFFSTSQGISKQFKYSHPDGGGPGN